MTHTFPQGFICRPPCEQDVETVTNLIIAFDLQDSGAPDMTQDDIREDWERPGFDLQRDAWLVIPQGGHLDGQAVGYANVWYRADQKLFMMDGYVHPLYCGLGIGRALLGWMETRIRQQADRAPAGEPLVIRNGISGKDQAAIQLHEELGYHAVRYFWRMEIELNGEPTAPAWPAGVEARTFVLDQDERPVYEALDDAFSDHWGHVGWIYDLWCQRMYGKSFDPSLYFVAQEVGQPGNGAAPLAGAALCNYRGEIGWVQTLGVRRPWRQHGLGLALLQQAFGEFYRRGKRRVGLSVDAQNPTGATRLYQRAGMHVAHKYILYEKELNRSVSEHLA